MLDFKEPFLKKSFLYFKNTYKMNVFYNPTLRERHLLLNLVYSFVTFYSMHKPAYVVLVFQNSRAALYITFCIFIHVLYLSYIPY